MLQVASPGLDSRSLSRRGAFRSPTTKPILPHPRQMAKEPAARDGQTAPHRGQPPCSSTVEPERRPGQGQGWPALRDDAGALVMRCSDASRPAQVRQPQEVRRAPQPRVPLVHRLQHRHRHRRDDVVEVVHHPLELHRPKQVVGADLLGEVEERLAQKPEHRVAGDVGPQPALDRPGVEADVVVLPQVPSVERVEEGGAHEARVVAAILQRQSDQPGEERRCDIRRSPRVVAGPGRCRARKPIRPPRRTS